RPQAAGRLLRAPAGQEPPGGVAVTDLAFDVLDAVPEKFAAAPHLLFRMRVRETSGAIVHAIALRCQLRIEPQRRPYDPGEQAALADLFGTADRYGNTLKPFLWTHATA